MVGPGQVLREAAADSRLLQKFLIRYRYKLGLFGWLSLGLASLVAIPLFLGWLTLSVLGFGLVATRLGVSNAVDYLLWKIQGLTGLVIGLFKPPRPPESFPLEEVELLKQAASSKNQSVVLEESS